ncbi:hypothetical protein INT45_002336 [Circinella minor]|uniref:Protein Abitram n=1 Tax=Circinella minor TaxID=1195481 RepID=A0A8H7RYC8_9FUNG|nr:hypothetical protein INT45_002336 [Circinella minor]
MSDDDYDIQQHLDLVKPWNNDPTAFLSRYYTLHYHRDSENKIYVRQAPNKVCILGITDQHVVKKNNNQDQSVQIIPKAESNSNVKPNTLLCEIAIGDSQRYEIKAHMYGKLLEINPRLLEKPELLLDLPMTEGYLALIKAQHEDTSRQLEEFVSADTSIIS